MLTVILLCALILFSRSNHAVTKAGAEIVNTIAMPINKAVYFVSSKAVAVFEDVFGSREMREQNRQLEIQNQLLQDQLTVLQNIVSKEEFLKDEYELKKKEGYQLKSAYVTGKDPGGMFIRFTIDLGSRDGVFVGDTVVQAAAYDDRTVIQCLVGRVTEVGYNWAKVSAIAQEGNSISFVSARTQDQGIINGYSERGLSGYLLNEQADIKVGDKLLTSGLGEVYPRDIYIGEVLSVEKSEDDLLKEVTVYSPLDFSKMYRVFVLQKGAETRE